MFAPEHFFNDLSQKKPHIAISACLVGERVRYDGNTKYHSAISEFFSDNAILTSLCPETGAGLSVPRPAIQLVENNNAIKALGVNNNALDVTADILRFSTQIQQHHQDTFQAIILKARSPSCGVHSTPIVDHQNQLLRYDKGLFTNTLNPYWLNCIFLEDEDLQTIEDKTALLLRCYMLLDVQLTARENYPLLFAHYHKRFPSMNNIKQLIPLIKG